MLPYLNFLAGIALMLYGIRTLRKGSDRLFGARLRRLLQAATKGKFRTLLAGFLLSILTPSSTAVALLSVEAMNAGYVTLPQVLVLMLGAGIGFTVTVQLLAFKFYIYNAVFIAVGAPFFLLGRRQTVRGAGQALLGIGFLLLAIQMLSDAIAPLKGSGDVQQLMHVLENHSVWLIVLGLALQVALQSSTTTIGIAIALCSQQLLPLTAALAVVVGANIGIAVTALIAGYARIETRRMAIGNLLMKAAGAVVCLPLLGQIVELLRPLSPAGDTQVVANAHTLFNIVLAVVFLPLVPVMARLLQKLVAAPATAEEGFGPRYLDRTALESPALALAQATREILHMADEVRTMLRDAHRAFQENSEELCARIQQRDDRVDLLNTEIKNYISRLAEQGLNREESRREIALLGFATELETIGDVIDKNLVELAKKRIALRVGFSKDGWVELNEYFQRVLENFEIAVSAFASQDRQLAEKLLRHKRNINETERELRNSHFHRLNSGLVESVETSAIHLDVLTNLKHINSHLTAVAYPILENHR